VLEVGEIVSRPLLVVQTERHFPFLGELLFTAGAKHRVLNRGVLALSSKTRIPNTFATQGFIVRGVFLGERRIIRRATRAARGLLATMKRVVESEDQVSVAGRGRLEIIVRGMGLESLNECGTGDDVQALSDANLGSGHCSELSGLSV